jgi:hypothetical protein
MLDDISILFVLVVWSCRLNDSLDPVYRTRDSIASDEFGKIPRENIRRERSGRDGERTCQGNRL